MGGNAIKDPKTGKSLCQRLVKESYELIKKLIIERLQNHGIICEIILELPEKQDFGDLDVLYLHRLDVDMRQTIKELFDVKYDKYIVNQGNVTSFAFNCMTIGLSNTFFQVGAILGCLFNFHGLKFGDAGLRCELLQSTVDPTTPNDARFTIGKIMLSQDVKSICEFAGLDYHYWQDSR